MAEHVAEVSKSETPKMCPVSVESVQQAVKALYFTLKAKSTEEPVTKKAKKILEDDDEKRIFLVINTHKIQPAKDNYLKASKILLPHSIHNEVTRICLFVKDTTEKPDEDSDAASKQAVQDLLRTNGITTIDEVMTLHQLRSEFKTFESKRNLCLSYDLFLTDKRINKFLYVLLGREFYEKRRLPIKVDMRAKNFKAQFDTVLNTTTLYQNNKGSSKSVQVALTTLDEESVVANVMEAVKRLETSMAGGWANIRRLHIKSLNSMAIPLYVSTELGTDVHLVRPKKSGVKTVMDDLPTRLNTKVKVYPDGRVRLYKDRSMPDGKNLVDDPEPRMKVSQYQVLREKKTSVAQRMQKKERIANRKLKRKIKSADRKAKSVEGKAATKKRKSKKSKAE